MKKIPQGRGSAGVSVSISESQTAWLWDGKPKAETAAGYGH